MDKVDVWWALGRVWRRPARTAAALTQAGQGRGVALGAVLIVGATLPVPSIYEVGEEAVRVDWGQLPMVVASGMGAAFLTWILAAWLFRNFSRMFGGTATVAGCRVGIGLGLVPFATLSIAVTLLSLFIVPAAYEPVAQGLDLRADYARWVGPFSFVAFGGLLYSYGVFLLAITGTVGLGIMRTFLAFAITVAVSVFPITFLLQLLTGRLSGVN